MLCIGLTVGVLLGDLQKFLRQIKVNDEIETTDSVYTHIEVKVMLFLKKNEYNVLVYICVDIRVCVLKVCILNFQTLTPRMIVSN